MAEEASPVVRVMIVEDDPETLDRFAQVLAHDPRTAVVAKAPNGRDAISNLPGASPDVLLVDLGLPDMHGTEVIRHARHVLPDCDIMVITLFGDEHNVLASIEAGATGYVLKDSSDEQLVARVLELRSRAWCCIECSLAGHPALQAHLASASMRYLRRGRSRC
jgi:DNA-binding NarL/FixJ family response regulator